MDLNQNTRESADEGSHEFIEQNIQDEFPETQHAVKRPGSSRKSQSRPTSRAASIGQHSQTRSNTQRNKSWNSINPYINFMSDFRKTQIGERSTNIFRLGGEQWRNMTIDEKQPYVDAANENKKLKQPQSDKKQQQKQTILDKQKSKTGTSKDNLPSTSTSSRKVLSPKNKRKRSQQRPETQLKKKRTNSETETDTDSDTSGSIHTATTDRASEDSDESF